MVSEQHEYDTIAGGCVCSHMVCVNNECDAITGVYSEMVPVNNMSVTP